VQWELPGAVARGNQCRALGFFLNPGPQTGILGRTGALNARPSASRDRGPELVEETRMIRKLKDGRYRLYSRKKNPKTGKPRNLGTFKTRQAAEKHEREVQYFKRH
jgi:hypothetical protein